MRILEAFTENDLRSVSVVYMVNTNKTMMATNAISRFNNRTALNGNNNREALFHATNMILQISVFPYLLYSLYAAAEMVCRHSIVA